MVAKTALPVTLDLMRWGKAGVGGPGAKVNTIPECEEMLKTFVKYGHDEVDNAYIYNGGTAEEYLGQVRSKFAAKYKNESSDAASTPLQTDYKSLGIKVDTKLYPAKSIRGTPDAPTHSAEDIDKYFKMQLKACNTDCFDMWYLHGPDRKTPFEETLKAIDVFYKQGKFKRFGLSNYMGWEVMEIYKICEANGYCKPTAVQGVYNCLHRNVEPELFPLLRKLGISFYAFNPMVGGLFTGSIKREDKPDEAKMNPAYAARYFKDQYFDAIDLVQPLATKHNLTLIEIALRWEVHHSLLRKEFGDNVLIGASNVAHMEANLKDLEKGPLPEEIVEALGKGWKLVQPFATNYWH